MTISALGWVSFGSAEAEALNALIGALADSEARDELRIGAIRDGFSDLLFPGTSTVQTRLRYFLMIPQNFHNIYHPAARFFENHVAKKSANKRKTEKVCNRINGGASDG
jgi:hypothetical protein